MDELLIAIKGRGAEGSDGVRRLGTTQSSSGTMVISTLLFWLPTCLSWRWGGVWMGWGECGWGGVGGIDGGG